MSAQPTSTATAVDRPPTIDFDEVSIEISAPAIRVYNYVAFITNMGKISPETYKTTWLHGAHGPEVGATFRGWNRSGLLRWFTDCEVIAADPPREFTFQVKLSTVRWSYLIEETPAGCIVTERRTQDRPSTISKISTKFLGRDRPGTLRRGMITTLDNLKAATERP